jgi:ribosomal silencing factor RsfS
MKYRLEELWQQYKKMVVNPHASEVQVKDMRNTFYAGATSAYSIFINATNENNTEMEAIQVLDELNTEIEEHSGQTVADALRFVIEATSKNN